MSVKSGLMQEWKNLCFGLREQRLKGICELAREYLRYPRIALRLVDSYILHLYMDIGVALDLHTVKLITSENAAPLRSDIPSWT